MKTNGILQKLLNGKGFYVALGLCLVAIGVSAWAAAGNRTVLKGTPNSSTVQVSSVTESAALTEQKTTGVPKNSSSVTGSKKAESSKKQSSAPASENSSAAKPTAKYFVYPLTGEIIKDFNKDQLQYSITYNDMRIHTGLDIAAKEGTAVKSAGDGTVLAVGKDEKLGYTVKIDHGNNISVVYAGLKEKASVKKGDIVAPGTVLGALGTVTCESLEAPHLHLEFYEGETVISPLELLGKVGEQ